MLAHNVYFSLHDQSEAAKNELVAGCHKFLTDHPGMLFYAAGTASDIDRPVTDRDYDVALCTVFRDRAAHDEYQAAPRHRDFIERFKANWKKVRVFDSDVSPAPW